MSPKFLSYLRSLTPYLSRSICSFLVTASFSALIAGCFRLFLASSFEAERLEEVEDRTFMFGAADEEVLLARCLCHGTLFDVRVFCLTAVALILNDYG